MVNSNPSANKKAIIISCIIFGILGIIIAIAFIYEKQQEKKLLQTGIKQEALIVGKYIEERRSNKSTSYTHYFKISFFIDTAKKTVVKDTSSKPKSKIDSILDNISFKNKSLGALQMFNLRVEESYFKKYLEGDHIKVIYLKEKPNDARLLEELTD